MKKFSKIVSLLLAVLILTGCVRQKVSMKINKNGDIDVSIIDAYSSSAGQSVSDSQKEQYKKNGFKVSDYEADDYKGVKLSKKLKISEVSSDSPVTLSLNDLKEQANPKMFQKTGKNQYKASMVLDASEYSGSGADISYTVTLPSKPISHNADKVDGNTLTWTIDLGQKKDINYEFSVSGGNSVLWIILGIVGVAAVAIVVVVVLNNKNKSNGLNVAQPTMPNPGEMPSIQPTVNPVENVNTMAPEAPVMPTQDVVTPDATVVPTVEAPVENETPVAMENTSVVTETPVDSTVTMEPTQVETPEVPESVSTETTTVEETVVEDSEDKQSSEM